MATCYMCDAPATSREHVPPECLFPPGHRKNLITVPSCDRHNTKKCGDDEVVAYLLGLQAGANCIASGPRLQKLLRAIKRREGLARAVFKNPRPVIYGHHETRAIDVDRNRFDRVMDRIARGLFYHRTDRKHFDSLAVYSPNLFHMDLPGARKANEKLQALRPVVEKAVALFPVQGENPEVFKYQLRMELPDRIMLRMAFYEGVEVVVYSTRTTNDRDTRTSAA